VAYESPTSDDAVDDNDQMRVDSNNNSNTDHSLPPNRQPSENSTSELERQLFKDPSMIMNTGEEKEHSSSPPLSLLQEEESKVDATTNEQSATNTTTERAKPYIEYEIQCHILFRDPNSFFTNRHNGLNTGLNSHTNNNRDVHHSWSVWKRFSELQALDEELRYDFGWQMDAFTSDNKDDNRAREMGSILSSGEREGIVFPSAHGLESWWYNVRNGGGVVNTLLGESSDVVSSTSDGREKKSEVANRAGQQQGSGWGSSLYSYFRTNSTNSRRNSTETNNSHTSNGNCPIPIPFIERRQKELASYWSDLMKIEDIFEFSVHSHKFGKTMAAFLGVDKVLLERRKDNSSISGAVSLSSSPLHQQHHPSRFPAIHENEPELYGTSLRPSLLDPSERLSTMTPTREVSGLTIHDDDVSLLSDGTGAFDNHHLTSHNSPIRGQPMVDVVPKQYAGENGSQSPLDKKVLSSSKSVASTSVASRKNRIKAPRAKPAFQRQFLTP